jgi:prepilin-type N-terminal cleavage/methylation domain-containing protein
MKMTNVSPHNGFTLVELMVAAAASVILIGITLSSLISFQQMSQGMDDRLKQEAEIQRALHFIAADIQEGKSIQAGAPERSGYSEVFQIVRPDGSTIGYYTIPRGSRVWSGPQIVYRVDDSDKKLEGDDPSEPKAYALIDQISAQSPQKCTGTGTQVPSSVEPSSVGFSLFIDKNSKATVCIRGYLKDNPDGIEGSIQAATRVRAEP